MTINLQTVTAASQAVLAGIALRLPFLVTGGAARTHDAKLRDQVSTADFTSLDACIAALGASATRVTVTAGTYAVTANTTFPATLTINVLPGAVFNVSPGIILSFLGDFTAPPVQIFTGTGTVEVNSTLSPEWWSGTNTEKILKAVVQAIRSQAKIQFKTLLDITGLGPIVIPAKTRRFMVIEGVGGGIRKDDAGYVFTAAVADISDIRISGMRYQSIAGAGAIVWDCNKLIRIYSSRNEYRDWDTVVEADSRYIQQGAFIDEHVIGGRGWAARFKESYCARFIRWTIEERNAHGTVTFNVAASTATIPMLLNDGSPVYFITTGTLPTGIVADTTYYVVNRVAGSTLKVAATVGGTAIALGGTPTGVHTLYIADGHGICNSSEVPGLQNRNLVIEQCVIEVNKGIGLQLANTTASVIHLNYFENLRGAAIDMQTYQTNPHSGLQVSSNIFGPNAQAAILWGRISASGAAGFGGTVSSGNFAEGALHNISTNCEGFIFGSGDVSGGALVAGKVNQYKLATQYKVANNGDGSRAITHGFTQYLSASLVRTIGAGVTANATFTFADGVGPLDIVSVTTSFAFDLQVLAIEIVPAGGNVLVWLKNLDTVNPITRTLYCNVQKLVL